MRNECKFGLDLWALIEAIYQGGGIEMQTCAAKFSNVIR